MGFLRRAAVRIGGGREVESGARELASEYAAMLAQAGIPTRIEDAESEDRLAFVAVTDARFGEILVAVQGTPDPGGYLVVPAPTHQPKPPRGGDLLHAWAWPGRGMLAGEGPLRSLLSILASVGLVDPDGDATRD